MINQFLFAFLALTLATTTIAGAQETKGLPVRIYLLVGQSNMQGKAPIEGDKSNSLQSIFKGKKFPKTIIQFNYSWIRRATPRFNPQGTRTVCRQTPLVWIRILTRRRVAPIARDPGPNARAAPTLQVATWRQAPARPRRQSSGPRTRNDGWRSDASR